jgi:hypothetical protein
MITDELISKPFIKEKVQGGGPACMSCDNVTVSPRKCRFFILIKNENDKIMLKISLSFKFGPSCLDRV